MSTTRERLGQMALYRDSQLGLCLDIRGEDGNIWVVWAVGTQLAQQLGNEKDWHDAQKAAKALGANYITHLNVFKEFFPIVTLIGYDEVVEKENGCE